MKKSILLPLLALLLIVQSCANGQGKKNETKDGATITAGSNLTRKQYDALLKSDKIVLIDFYADWCGPCKMMKPFLEEIAEEMKDKVVVIKIDADQNSELCQELSIEALPTLIVYKKGTMMWHQVGFAPKEEVLKYLK